MYFHKNGGRYIWREYCVLKRLFSWLCIHSHFRLYSTSRWFESDGFITSLTFTQNSACPKISSKKISNLLYTMYVICGLNILKDNLDQTATLPLALTPWLSFIKGIELYHSLPSIIDMFQMTWIRLQDCRIRYFNRIIYKSTTAENTALCIFCSR